MQMSPQMDLLATALAKAQGSFESIVKDKFNPFFKSNYASLEAIIDSTRKSLAANGLSFIQSVDQNPNGAIIVNTLLMHASGQWILGPIFGNPKTPSIQDAGSCITYLKRYGLQAMLGVASSEDDDDGNQASGKKADTPPTGYEIFDMKSDKMLQRLHAGLKDMKIEPSSWGMIAQALNGKYFVAAEVQKAIGKVEGLISK